MNTMKKKILILGNSALVVYKFRKEIVQKLIQEGYEVWTAFPNGPFGEGKKLSKQYGCKFVEVPINRRGKNPFQDLVLLHCYYKMIRKINPDCVLAYTVKCDIYGGIACRWARIPFIPNITGLGTGLANGGTVALITRLLYRYAIEKSSCVFFQNSEDKRYFDKYKIKYRKGIILPGSGVNLKDFTPLPYPDDRIVRFVYVARVMKAKGIEQYLDAARELKKKYGDHVEFHICGYCEEDYKDILKIEGDKGVIIYHGLLDSVITLEEKCHCIVLPTFHPEGVSNVLLEGAACARPLITTKRVGCAETVDDGVSGYLINERDSIDLIDKMEKFIALSNEERRIMGIYGRKKIEEKFNRKIVVDSYLNELEMIRKCPF